MYICNFILSLLLIRRQDYRVRNCKGKCHKMLSNKLITEIKTSKSCLHIFQTFINPNIPKNLAQPQYGLYRGHFIFEHRKHLRPQSLNSKSNFGQNWLKMKSYYLISIWHWWKGHLLSNLIQNGEWLLVRLFLRFSWILKNGNNFCMTEYNCSIYGAFQRPC